MTKLITPFNSCLGTPAKTPNMAQASKSAHSHLKPSFTVKEKREGIIMLKYKATHSDQFESKGQGMKTDLPDIKLVENREICLQI